VALLRSGPFPSSGSHLPAEPMRPSRLRVAAVALPGQQRADLRPHGADLGSPALASKSTALPPVWLATLLPWQSLLPSAPSLDGKDLKTLAGFAPFSAQYWL